MKNVSRIDFVFLYPYSMKGLRMHSSTIEAWFPRLYNRALISLNDRALSGAGAVTVDCFDLRVIFVLDSEL